MYNQFSHPPPPLPQISPLTLAENQRKSDTEFINNFINFCPQLPQKPKKKRLGILETRQLIASIKASTILLETCTNNLKTNKNSRTFDWEFEREKCKDLKSKIVGMLKRLKENEKISEFRKMIEQRRKKRLRQKRRKLEEKMLKSLREDRRNKLHKEIDEWIRSKRELIDKEKQEETLIKDADLVLGDVRGKRSDAKRYLNVLKELKSLRRVKCANARARGENLSSAADESFERIITGLIDQWSVLDREYSIEEHGLKLMLQRDNDRVIERKKRSGFEEWEVAIFGRKLEGFKVNGGDLNQVVMIRGAWDRFIGNGGRIPIGWIIPEPPGSAAWQKYLKK